MLPMAWEYMGSILPGVGAVYHLGQALAVLVPVQVHALRGHPGPPVDYRGTYGEARRTALRPMLAAVYSPACETT